MICDDTWNLSIHVFHEVGVNLRVSSPLASYMYVCSKQYILPHMKECMCFWCVVYTYMRVQLCMFAYPNKVNGLLLDCTHLLECINDYKSANHVQQC